jgi:hypothetical protein
MLTRCENSCYSVVQCRKLNPTLLDWPWLALLDLLALWPKDRLGRQESGPTQKGEPGEHGIAANGCMHEHEHADHQEDANRDPGHQRHGCGQRDETDGGSQVRKQLRERHAKDRFLELQEVARDRFE